MDLRWWGEDLGEKQRTCRAVCLFGRHSTKAQLSVDCVDKIGICASKSVCSALPMNKVFMQETGEEKTKTMHMCIFLWVKLF